MMSGYTKALLLVNLTENSVSPIQIPPATLRKYIGGTGMAAKMLWDETRANTEPFSEENPLIFMVGPLTGTIVPSSNRYVAASISPLTGIWGESYAGGSFPFALGKTPFIGVIIKGRASRPVTLWIDDRGGRITDASHLWGRDTVEVDEMIKKEAGQTAGVITIGVAGERQVHISSIVGDGSSSSRVAARCGLGAVMGWKNLKAVVVRRGTGRKHPVFDEGNLKARVREFFPPVKFDAERWQKKIGEIWPPTRGLTCIKNFSQADFPGFQEKIFQLAQESTPRYCVGCRTGCHLNMFHGNHKHPPGQHLQTLGSNCGIDDMDALLHAFELCNRLGLDSMSIGQTLAFGMELFEKGLLSKKDCDNLELVWGNAPVMLEMITKIGRREGIGALFGEGVRSLAKRVGGTASDYAMHSKGLEFPRYDPRANNAMALQYATSSRGAHHMEGFLGIVIRTLQPEFPPYALPYMGTEAAQNAAKDLFAAEGTAELVAWSQNLCSLIDSLGVCKFLANPIVWVRDPDEPFNGIKPEQFLTWLNCVTGWDIDFKDFIITGERIFNLKRAFNVRRGIDKKDDTLPVRILTQPRGGTGAAANNLPPLHAMLSEYYRIRGWSEQGIPTREKLLELDLPEQAGSEEIPFR